MSHVALLDAALEAAVIEGSHSFSWFGKRPPALAKRVRRLLSPADARDYLLGTLVDCLYSNFYCRGFASPAEWLGPGAAPLGDLSEELSRANAGTGRWDEGWTVHDVEDDYLRVIKYGLVLAITRDQFRPDRRDPVSVGSSGATLLPAELHGISPGFYMALSDRSEPGPQEVVRLYWNVTAAGVAPLTAALTACLNADQVSFHFKALKTTAPHGRCDVAVLYFARADTGLVLRHAARVHAEVAGFLRPLTPVFTKRLAPGLGVAEQPDPETSFGVHRCRLIATGLLGAHDRGQRSFTSRRSAVLEEFVRTGLDMAALHLNPGSNVVYELPAGAGRQASIVPAIRGGAGARPTTFLQVADGIGRRLAREALWHEGRCTWVGAFPSESAGSQRAAGPELYSGTAGIGLFLAELSAATGDDDFARTARAALRQSFHTADAVRPSERLGLFTGWPGIAWAAVRVERALADDGLTQAAEALVERLRECLPEPHDADLMAGSAGAILALAVMGRDAGPRALDVAIALAECLLERSVLEGDASSWRTVNGGNEYNLTGLSHGAAGIGLAMAELAALTGDGRYRDAARRAFAYEEQWFDAHAANWPDLRGVRARRGRPRHALPFSNFWCHGAAGIALSRVRAFELLDDARYLRDARRGLATVRAWLTRMSDGGGVNFSLCHGLAGNAEVLGLVAEAVEPEPDADLALMEEVAWAGVERHVDRVEDWPCAAGGGPTQGLMLGLAGIGHFYLRLHDPTTPPVLLPVRPAAGADRVGAPSAATRKMEGDRRCQA